MFTSQTKAHGMICPVRTSTQANSGGAGTSASVMEMMCVSDRCMAWRWSYSDEYGYCGIAGVPKGAGPQTDAEAGDIKVTQLT